MLQTLPNLTLHSDEHVGASSGPLLHFWHLCMHSLRTLIFEPSADIVPFVLRHPPTSSAPRERCAFTLTHTSIAPTLALIYDFLPGKAAELLVPHLRPLRGRAYRPRLSACQRSRYAYISSGIGLFWISSWTDEVIELRNAVNSTIVASRSETCRES